jgi:O-acetyl-ADP-ribose deacetylase (regulator of RNase III)
MASTIPSIHLLCMEQEAIDAFNHAKTQHNLPPSITITTHHSRLDELDPSLTFDAIVSPANSYARLDGGFDGALSRALAPANDYSALTRVAQAAVYKEYRGFLPPGACLLVDLDGEGGDRLKESDVWGCKYLALCPTMKEPQNVLWDREVVYECIWTLLAAIDRHNRSVRERPSSGGGMAAAPREIKEILMTPLATGTGRWSNAGWAAQTVIAIRHFVDAVERGGVPERGWSEITPVSSEVEKTYRDRIR